MSPAELGALMRFAESLCWLALLCGVAGGVLSDLMVRLVVWIWDRFADKRYKAYRAACQQKAVTSNE